MFRDELHRAIERIAEHPDQFPIHDSELVGSCFGDFHTSLSFVKPVSAWKSLP